MIAIKKEDGAMFLDFDSCDVLEVGGVAVRHVWQADHGWNGRVEEINETEELCNGGRWRVG
jgi:hypothetical protein